jgi:iron complex outermembrane receptor protein
MKNVFKNQNYWKRILSPVCLILVVIPAISQEVKTEEDSLQKIPEVTYIPTTPLMPEGIVVTGSRLDHSTHHLGNTAANIIILTKEEIRQMPAFSIDQILRFAAGVEVQTRSNFGAQADFSIRGSTFNQVIVLLDGVRIFDPLTGHSNSFLPIGLEEIERIEVVRGGASYIFGSDAIGGAINIVTKAHHKMESGTTDVAAQFGVGDHRLIYTRAHYIEDFDKLRVMAAGNVVSADGNLLPTGVKNSFAVSNFSAALRFAIRPKSYLVLRVGAVGADYNAQNYYTALPSDTARGTQQVLFSMLNYVKQKQKGNYRRWDLSIQESDGTYKYNYFVSENIHATRFVFMQGSESFSLNGNIRVNVGFQGDYKQIKSNDRGHHGRLHGGVFAASHHRLRRFLIEPALRYDYDQRGGHFWSPNISIFRTLWNGNIGLKAGKANRVADFTELYVNHAKPGILGAGRDFGNPNLKVESAWNLELNYEFKSNDKTRWTISVFRRWGIGIIDYSPTPASFIPHHGQLNPSANYSYPQNLSDVNYSGAEWSFSKYIHKGNWVNIFQGMYVFMFSSLSKGVYTKYISNHAVHQGQLIWNLKYKKRVQVNIAGVYKQRRLEESTDIIKPSREFLVGNVGASYWFVPEKLALRFMVENVANTAYIDVLGAHMAPRWITLGIIYRP